MVSSRNSTDKNELIKASSQPAYDSLWGTFENAILIDAGFIQTLSVDEFYSNDSFPQLVG